MYKVSWFFRISAVATLALIVAVASLAGGFGTNALAATGTAAAPASKLPFELCKQPAPTPAATAKAATAAATMAATTAPTMAATTAATKVATVAATVAATTAATKAATAAAPTNVPPTATTIPKGQKPASARWTLRSNTRKYTRGGTACVEVFAADAGGPAQVAGITAGDLVLGIDKTAIKTAKEALDIIEKKSSGDKILVTVQRGTDEIAFSVTLGLNQFANPAAATGAATTAATKAATPAATKAK